MNIVIMGCGQIAFYLIDQLLDSGHKITLIEEVYDVGREMARRYEEINIIHGDGTNYNIMKQAGCADADYYIAVTGQDEDNLIGCQIAKESFSVRRTCARVNNPKNLTLFKHIGIDYFYSTTAIVVDMIEQDIDFEGMHVLYNLQDTPQNIVELTIGPKSDVDGKTLIETDFPGDSRVVHITDREGKGIIPDGNSVLHSGDRILIICREKDYLPIYRKLVNPDYKD